MVREIRTSKRLRREVGAHPADRRLGDPFGGHAELAETTDDLGHMLECRLQKKAVCGFRQFRARDYGRKIRDGCQFGADQRVG